MPIRSNYLVRIVISQSGAHFGPTMAIVHTAFYLFVSLESFLRAKELKYPALGDTKEMAFGCYLTKITEMSSCLLSTS